MSLLSVVTAVYEPEPEYLLAAYESLDSQHLPAGWEWEWLVQEDGRTGAAASILPADERIKLGYGRHNGVAITRNLALAASGGSLVKNLDQDDILSPGVLARDIAVLGEDGLPEVHWTVSRALDLLPDGSTAAVAGDPPDGRLPRGFVPDRWRAAAYRLPVHPATMCLRRNLITALGGWMAVPGSDDTGLLIAAGTLTVGYFHAEPGLLYRKWPGQESGQARHTEPVEWNARMSLIDERARALEQLWAQQSVPAS
ncbi:glycosyltransferase [Actinospica durhamensis]|uniref:Glycosyltransferase n=1 Tax=Actinospica durhamensis TaxID=1508375 RepID=A0A941IP35_9ACTN|nr:glycosyltransferase [Actinospica durhamensis]MBR7834674.1 glycosyltransferase [Actinospica durhamensis]